MAAKLMGLRRMALATGVAAAALLAAGCGGGGSQASKFQAQRVLAFGDETSVIVDVNGDGNGSKYGINGTVSSTDATIDCRFDALWVQVVANRYGLVFPQCNPGPTPVSAPASRIRAAFGAKAADLGAQIDAQLGESAFAGGDLATVLVGLNDVLAQYAQYPSIGEAQLSANLDAAGAEIGRQVNRLADSGVRVLVATVPDAGITPFAVAEKIANADTDRGALLTRLTARLNAALRATMQNDGRKIGLILLDEQVSAIGKFTGLNGFTNSVQGACDLSRSALVPPSVLDCTDLSLVAGATSASYLWADDRHLSPGGQQLLGNTAVSRAENNPF